MEESKYKPCPFCGAVVHVFTCSRECFGKTSHYWVGCDNCDCQGPWHESEEMAVKCWNMRAPIDNTEASVLPPNS